MLDHQRRLECYTVRMSDDPITNSEVRIAPDFLEEAQAICAEEIKLIEARIAKNKIPFPNKIPKERHKIDFQVKLASLPKAETSSCAQDSETQPSAQEKSSRGRWRRFLPWNALPRLAGVADLGLSLLENARPGGLAIVSARPEASALARFFRGHGREAILLSPGYGAGSAIAPGYLMRPKKGSFIDWVLNSQENLAKAGAIILFGDEDFAADIAILRASHDKPPVLFAGREVDGRDVVTEVCPRGLPPPGKADGGRHPLRISIVIVSFNQAAFLEAAFRSVIEQNYPNLDLIIIDGGSTDGSVEVIERYRAHFTHVVIEPDEGQSDALNKGFALATGEVMNWLCSDDLLEPGALQFIADAYRATQADLIVGGCVRIAATRSEELFRHHTAVLIGRVLSLQALDILKFMESWQKGNYFFQPEVFFSRRIWDASGGHIKRHLYYAMDYDLWLRMALAGASIYHIPAMIGASRFHAAQKTRANEEYMHQLMQIMEEYRDLFDAMKSARDAAGSRRSGRQTYRTNNG